MKTLLILASFAMLGIPGFVIAAIDEPSKGGWVAIVIAILGGVSGVLGVVIKLAKEAKIIATSLQEMTWKVTLSPEEKTALVTEMEAIHRKTCVALHPVHSNTPQKETSW